MDAWQDPDGREQQQYGHLSPPSPDPDVVPAPPTPESQFQPHPVENPVSSSSRVNVVRFRDSSGRFLPRPDSHQSAHDESENAPRVRNEPESSRDGQPIRVDAPDDAVISGDVEMQGEEFEVGAHDENLNFQQVPHQPSDENTLVESQSPHPLSHDCHIHEDESLLNSLRETCARDSQHRVFILFPRVKLLWHSVRIAWNLLVCRMDNEKRLVSKCYLVNSDMFENPGDDWLATASSGARARVDLNIDKLTADERAQFRAAQHQEMDQWISNDVISICQRAGIPKERVMTMR